MWKPYFSSCHQKMWKRSFTAKAKTTWFKISVINNFKYRSYLVRLFHWNIHYLTQNFYKVNPLRAKWPIELVLVPDFCRVNLSQISSQWTQKLTYLLCPDVWWKAPTMTTHFNTHTVYKKNLQNYHWLQLTWFPSLVKCHWSTHWLRLRFHLLVYTFPSLSSSVPWDLLVLKNIYLQNSMHLITYLVSLCFCI